MQVFRHEPGGTGRLACFKLRKNSGDVDRAVRYIVWHAYHHTSHYRRLLNQAGLSPARIRGARDLRVVPVTTRDLIMESSWRSILSDRAYCVHSSRISELSCPSVLSRSDHDTSPPLTISFRE